MFFSQAISQVEEEEHVEDSSRGEGVVIKPNMDHLTPLASILMAAHAEDSSSDEEDK